MDSEGVKVVNAQAAIISRAEPCIKLYKTEESDSSPKKTLNKSAGLQKGKPLLYNDKGCLCPDQVV